MSGRNPFENDLNQDAFWARRSPFTSGGLLFESPAELYVAIIEALQWMETHPLREEIQFHYKGTVVTHEVKKVRAFTWSGIALALGTTTQTLKRYRDIPQMKPVIDWLEEVIYTQKFEHAAAGLLNAGIISRDLGLADKKEVTGANGQPLQQVVQYQLPSNGRDDVVADSDEQ